MAAVTKVCKECGVTELYLSWSRLRVHEECKQKGMLQRTGKRPTIENVRNYFPGTVTDRVVRDWLLDSPMDNLGAMPDMVEGILEREQEAEEGKVVHWKSLGDKKSVIKDCQEAVTTLEPVLLKYVVPFEYEPDFRFKVPVDVPITKAGLTQTVILNGAMDILVRDNKGRWFVFDVKHTKDGQYYKKTAGQMIFYDLALELSFGSPATTTALLQPLTSPVVKPIPTGAEERAQLMQRIVGYANDLYEEDFAARTDTKLCQYCEVRHACVKFQPVMKDGKQRVEF